jgi:hypothetical protein
MKKCDKCDGKGCGRCDQTGERISLTETYGDINDFEVGEDIHNL